MDAISFVLGVQAKHLRGSHLKELIYNPHGKEAGDAESAVVRLVLKNAKLDKELVFERVVNNANKGGSEYRIDSKSVTKEVYDNKLQTLNILVRARNFLVFQVASAHAVSSFVLVSNDFCAPTRRFFPRLEFAHLTT
jgi:structural maintenance of chromosome 1